MKEDSAFGPGMMFGIPGPGPKKDTKRILSDPKKEKGKEISKMKMKKHIPNFDQFLNEDNLKDVSNEIPKNDVGYQMIFTSIANHLKKPESEIDEVDNIPNFLEGNITNFSSATEGNFVLNCGTTSDGFPACRLLDELNDEVTFYI